MKIVDDIEKDILSLPGLLVFQFVLRFVRQISKVLFAHNESIGLSELAQGSKNFTQPYHPNQFDQSGLIAIQVSLDNTCVYQHSKNN